MPQSQATANPRHQEEKKKDKRQRVQNKQTNPREAHRPALASPRVDDNAKRTEKQTREQMSRDMTKPTK